MKKPIGNLWSVGQGWMALFLFATPFIVCLADVCGTTPALAIISSILMLYSSLGEAIARKAVGVVLLVILCSVPLG